MKKIALIPIDNRPVTYELFKLIGEFNRDITLLMPPRGLLGSLKKDADVRSLLNWLKTINVVDYLVISLDTLIYGGLIPSRRHKKGYIQISEELIKIKEILKKTNSKIYANSSIMRISNNNENEEEKEYWSIWGKKIFDYSYNFHKAKTLKSYDEECKSNCIEKTIPKEILEDYLNTRECNFNVNKTFLEWNHKKIIDTLVFSKDDAAQFGLNVQEAKLLQNNIKKLKTNALIKTGADEIPLSLFTRALYKDNKPKIFPFFLEKEGKNLISKYEDVPLVESVEGQINLVGGDVVAKYEDADLIMIINNFKTEQGDLVLGERINSCVLDFELPLKPYFVVDVNNANGADNYFMKTFMSKKLDWNNFYGYSAWNTSANSIGSALATAINRFYSKNFDLLSFKKLQAVRFLDDWAYQANVRKKDISLMSGFEDIMNKFFNTDFKGFVYSYPWNRSFEVEVDVSNI